MPPPVLSIRIDTRYLELLRARCPEGTASATARDLLVKALETDASGAAPPGGLAELVARLDAVEAVVKARDERLLGAVLDVQALVEHLAVRFELVFPEGEGELPRQNG